MMHGNTKLKFNLERLGWEGEHPQRVVVPNDDDDDDDDDMFQPHLAILRKDIVSVSELKRILGWPQYMPTFAYNNQY